MKLPDYLQRRLEGLNAKRVLLVFDQFEEILTVDPTDLEVKNEFFEQVGTALRNGRCWGLFAMREDYLAALEPYLQPIPTRLRTTFRLDLLGEEAALAAVKEPAAKAGCPFAPDVAETLVDNLRSVQVQQPGGSMAPALGPYVEPVHLQVVCRRLWERLDEADTKIDESDIGDVGDVDSALRGYYADSVAAIATYTGVRERAIRDWVDRQLITESGFRGLALQGAGTSQGLDNRAIMELVDAHLVRAERRRGATWFELAHDRLIQPVRDDNAAWEEGHLSILQRQAALWGSQYRPEGLLLSGNDLIEAEQWAEAHAETMTPLEKEFLAESRKTREASELRLRAAEESARAQEIAKAAVSLHKRAIWIGAFALMAVVLAIVAGVFGIQANGQQQIAIDQKSTAEFASTAALQLRQTAEKASTAAIEQKSRAETASTAAIELQQTAQKAYSAAIDQKSGAELASTAALQQRQTAEAERDIANTAAAERDKAISDLKANLQTVAAQSDRSKTERSTTEAQLAIVQETQTAVAVRAATQTAQGQRLTPTATPTPRVTVSFPPLYRIVFVSKRPDQDALFNDQPALFIMEGDGSHQSRLQTKGEGQEPDYSHGQIIFAGRRDSTQYRFDYLHTIPLDGDAEEDIPGQNEDNWNPSFSPDRQKVVFVSNRKGGGENWDIYSMKIDGTNVQELAPHPAQDWAPAWSPDGHFIAFTSNRGEANGQTKIKTSEIWRMNADGSGLVRLTNNEFNDAEPSWSPDSSQIAFTTDRDGNQEIYVMNADGSNPRNLTKSIFNENFSAWSPDGNWLAFSRYTDHNQIYIMTISGDYLTNISNSRYNDWQPLWVPPR